MAIQHAQGPWILDVVATLLVKDDSGGSKYPQVRDHYGEFPEMNALEANPPGQGTGTALIKFAEQFALAKGAACHYLTKSF